MTGVPTAGVTPAFRAAPLAGDGLVARFPGLVCVARCPDPQPLARLLDLCASAAGDEPGRVLARRLAAWLGAADGPPAGLVFGVIAAAGASRAVFLLGDAEAVVGELRLSGADAAAWLDRLVPAGAGGARLVLPGVAPGPPPALLDLREGVVAGAGVELVAVQRAAERHPRPGGPSADERAPAAAPVAPVPVAPVPVAPVPVAPGPGGPVGGGSASGGPETEVAPSGGPVPAGSTAGGSGPDRPRSDGAGPGTDAPVPVAAAPDAPAPDAPAPDAPVAAARVPDAAAPPGPAGSAPEAPPANARATLVDVEPVLPVDSAADGSAAPAAPTPATAPEPAAPAAGPTPAPPVAAPDAAVTERVRPGPPEPERPGPPDGPGPDPSADAPDDVRTGPIRTSGPALPAPQRAERILGVAPGGPPRPPLEAGDAVATGSRSVVAGAAPGPGPGEARGLLCSRGHLNDPRAQSCVLCGVRMNDRTGVLVVGKRPPLGLLLFDDGATYTVDAEYVVGRMPESDERVRAGALRAIVVEDRSGAVSRVHAEVRVDGWDVLLVDAGSRNGTHVAGPGEPAWTALPPRHTHRLVPGTRVRMGARTFLFESPSGVR